MARFSNGFCIPETSLITITSRSTSHRFTKSPKEKLPPRNRPPTQHTCSPGRHQVDARFLRETLRDPSFLGQSVRGVQKGDARGSRGRRPPPPPPHRGRQKGVAGVVGLGDLRAGIRLHLGDGYAFMHVSRLSHASCQ